MHAFLVEPIEREVASYINQLHKRHTLLCPSRISAEEELDQLRASNHQADGPAVLEGQRVFHRCLPRVSNPGQGKDEQTMYGLWATRILNR